MRFSKWHALGNDYLLIERVDADALAPALVRVLCDRHRGIGGDGLLEVVRVTGTRAEVVIWNPDGSVAELSGNGTRIAARWLVERCGKPRVTITVGTRDVEATLRDGATVEQDMGPVLVGNPETLDIGDATIEFTPVSVGNPHAVIERAPDLETLLELGPLVEHHERFPERTNVQLAYADGAHEITMRVWERGVGETQASGTSACATAAALVVRGRCRSPVIVHQPGGDLEVSLDPSQRARLTGPAEEICHGDATDELLAHAAAQTATP